MEKNNYISIPYKVMSDKRLTQTQKLIYGFVAGFHVSGNICYASNAYIGEVIGLKVTAVSRAISKLVSEDWLEVKNGAGAKRSLYCKYVQPVLEDRVACTERQTSLSPETDNNLVNNLKNNKVDNKEYNKGEDDFAVPAGFRGKERKYITLDTPEF